MIAHQQVVISAPAGPKDGATEAKHTVATRLYGAELQRALAEDRIATRRLNNAELSRDAP